MVSRGNSPTADAYLSPLIRQYVRSLGSGFKGGLEIVASKLLFMQSDGGLCVWENILGLRAILSGPAGGVIGCARSCWDPEEKTPVLGFDMGGTSTDISRFSGMYNHIFETKTAEVAIRTPQLIDTVAAGGSSILHWKNGLFAIGHDVRIAYLDIHKYRGGNVRLIVQVVCRSPSGPCLLPQGWSPDRHGYQPISGSFTTSVFPLHF